MNTPVKTSKSTLEEISQVLEEGRRQTLWKLLNDLHDAEIAQLLESLRPNERLIAWQLVDSDNMGEILLHLNDEVRNGLLETMEASEIVNVAESMDIDDMADFLLDLPETIKKQVLKSLDAQNRQQLEAVMFYAQDTAGGIMNTDTVTVRADVTLELVQRYLQLRGSLPESTDNLIVINRFNQYLGSLALTTLLTNDQQLTVADVMNRELKPINAETPVAEVTQVFQNQDLISAPVVDDDNHLLGRITIDDVVDIMRDQADHNMMGRAGLDETEDMFAPIVVSAKRRAVWLGINLMTALLAAWAISLFQATIDKKVALAVLMPIAASMGGVAGMQTLTFVIRGLVLGQISKTNARYLIIKELSVGLLNGILWAAVVAAIAIVWYGEYALGGFIAAAMVINLACAAAAGFTIPFILKRMGIDPAIAGSVVLTTVTDVVGYIAFLGLATLYLFVV